MQSIGLWHTSMSPALFDMSGGPSWRLVGETRNTGGFSLAGSLDGVANRMGATSAPVDIVEEKPMTEADARAILEFVETNNPKLGEIEKLKLENGRVRAALRRRERMER